MPRKRRILPVGQPCHAVNRGQDRKTLFHEDAAYQHFIDLMTTAKQKYPVQLYSYSLMPNHFHMLLCPMANGAVSAYLQWVEGRHGCQLRLDTHTVGQGHVYQRRFWTQPIGSDERNFLNVQRYIEANPLAAGLVQRAEDWRWSSLWERQTRGRSLLDPTLVTLPLNWLDIVNRMAGSDPYPWEEDDEVGSDPPNTSR